MFIGIGLIMLLAETVFFIILIIALLIRIGKDKKNKQVEWGLLLGILWTMVSVLRMFNFQF
jgi:hypothetical protein